MRRALAASFFCALAALLGLWLGAAGAEPPRADAPTAHAPATAAPANPAPAQEAPEAPSPAPAPSQEAKPEPTPPQNLEQLDPGATIAILGKKVRDASGKDMGLVVDVLVDRDAKMRAAVIDFGGFLGVGSRKIAIDWRLLQFDPADHDAPIVLSLDRAEVQAAPEYKPSVPPGPIVLVGPPPAVGTSVSPGGQ